jgi:hypothetical protein
LVAHLEVTTEEHDAGRIDLAEKDCLIAPIWHAGPLHDPPRGVKSTQQVAYGGGIPECNSKKRGPA